MKSSQYNKIEDATVNTKKVRQSNIELLRIISMLLIISFHYVYKSGYISNDLSINTFIVKTFCMFGELGVNLFILITGYFMIKSKFSLKKLIYLILEVEFCNILVLLVANALDIIDFSVSTRDNLIAFFPIIFNQYWFITAYIIIYILSPFINLFLNNMSKRIYQNFLLISVLIWCIIPTVFGLFYNSTESLLYYSRFIWLSIIYSIGSYIRLYQINIFKEMNNSIKCAIISFGIMIAGIFIIYFFKAFFKKVGTTELAYFWTPNNLPMLILSISVFEIFLKIQIKNNNIINKLASTTLCIYMLHDSILNTYIWQNIFQTLKHLRGKYSIIHILFATIVIFTVGAIVDIIRQFIQQHTVSKLLESELYTKQVNKISKLTDKILELL